MASKVAKKIGMADFAKKNNDGQVADAKADGVDLRRKSDAFKFKVPPFGSGFETQQANAQDHVAKRSSSADRNVRADKDNTHLEVNPEGVNTRKATRPPSPRFYSSANTTRWHDDSQPHHVHGFGQAHDEYPLSSDGEDANNATNKSQPAGQSYLSDVNNLMAKSADFVNGTAIQQPSHQSGRHSISSYPETSDGRATDAQQSPPPVHASVLKAPTPDPSCTNQVTTLKRNRHEAPLKRMSAQLPVSTNLDEHGARYLVTQAQNFHKNHAQQQAHSRPRPPTRKPILGGAPAHTDDGGDQVDGPNPDPYMEHTHSFLRSFESHAHSKPTINPPLSVIDSQSATPVDNLQALKAYSLGDLDYDAPALHDKLFSDLMSEPFDHDPRKPLEMNLTASSLRAQLDRLTGSADKDQKHSFFEGLSLQEWEQAGEWIPEQLGLVRKTVTQKRQERRSVAKRFEQEVARREKIVRKDADEVGTQLKEMKSSGGKVLEIRGSVRRARS